MKKLLYISANPRLEASRTQKLSDAFIEKLNASGFAINSRDLAKDPVPHFTPASIEAVMTPEQDRSDALKTAFNHVENITGEVINTNYLVISAPMYNFSVPSILKAYIDNIVMMGYTFEYTDQGPVGLLKDKNIKCLIVTTRGGIYNEGPFQPYNHFDAYLQSIFGFLGITDISFVVAEGLDFLPEEEQKKSIEAAENQLDVIAEEWGKL